MTGAVRDLVIVTGKGGVGKTTIAAAIALVAADAGRDVLVAELVARDDVPAAAGLQHLSIDPQRALGAYLHQQLPAIFAEVLVRSRVVGPLTVAAPGLPELLSIGQAWDLTHTHDLVVVDAPSTGHALAVLSAPANYARLAHGGAVQRQAAEVAATLRDPGRTAVVLVATPEELAVNETIDLQRALTGELGMAIDQVVVNRVLPPPLTDPEVAALKAAPPDPAIASALWLHRAAGEQQRQLARLRAAVGSVPLRTIALRFEGLAAADALREVGAAL